VTIADDHISYQAGFVLTSWSVLDTASTWMREFTSALGKTVPTIGWIPEFSWFGLLQHSYRKEAITEPPLNAIRFPLQRGYAKAPMRWFKPLSGRVVATMINHFPNVSNCALVCTAPFYAPVAEKWPGPVVYYSTDLTAEYDGVDREQVRRLDAELCARAAVVCPNSRRISDYLVKEAACGRSKITVIPNATRAANIRQHVVETPDECPSDLADLPRPIAGVIGNLAGNMDWVLLREAIRQTSWLQWALVGPTSMPIDDRAQSEAREAVMRMGGRVRFTGSRSYGQLQRYARAFDVAVLPYMKREPTYSGSSTRFYEHLAAIRPILATRGFEELLHKEPLLKLVDTAEELAARLGALKQIGFRDGYETMRWLASQEGTWEMRSLTMQKALALALSTTPREQRPICRNHLQSA
jgi:glycosyltransferase involved in cell wall biosynthesis